MGLSWDFGSNGKANAFGGTSSLLGGNANLMDLLAKMENKTTNTTTIKSTEDNENTRIPKGIPITDRNRSRVEEFYLDVFLLIMLLVQIFDEPELKKPVKKVKETIEVTESGEGGEGGEGGEKYDDDKKMNKYLKFNAIIKQNPSQVIRYYF